jgi:hypothetical protein
VQRGGGGDLEEAVGSEEQRQDGHEDLAVPSGDVHRVGGTTYEAIAFSCQCGKTIALCRGDLVKRPHANGQPDMRRPAGVRRSQSQKKKAYISIYSAKSACE